MTYGRPLTQHIVGDMLLPCHREIDVGSPWFDIEPMLFLSETYFHSHHQADETISNKQDTKCGVADIGIAKWLMAA